MSLSHNRARFASQGLAALAASMLLLAFVGCSGSATGSTASSGVRPTANQVLDDMVKAYAQTPTYADSGELHMQFDYGADQHVDERVDFAVTLARPNKLRMHCYQAIVLCDGKELHATVADLDKQLLEVPAPEKLTPENLYADEALRQALTQQIAGSSPQVALLIGEGFLNSALDGGKAEILKTETIDDEPCDVVKIARKDGDLVFAVGQRSHALRRIEYPTTELAKHLEQQVGGPVRNLRLWADLRGAKLGEEIEPVAFEFQKPADAKIVQQFDLRPLMPAPPAPSKLLGQPINEFTFTRLDGTPVTRESLSGKIAVIDFWATWCAPCLQSLPNLNQVYEQFKDNDRIEFIAVSIDQAEVTPEKVEEAFKQIGVSVPIARDAQQTSFQAFHVEGIPNMFILGPDGTVEDNEVGMNPELAKELPARLEKLLAGEHLYEDTLARHEERQKQYEAALAAPQQPAGEEQARATVAPQAAPAQHQLEEIWSCKDLERPGNILVVEAADGTKRLIINDGWQNAAEVDLTGKVLAKHDLKLPPMCVVSYLRSAVDTSGRRWYLGSASTQKQLHVFDEQFQTQLSYPADEAEIADALFTDLDDDGNPEISLGYWGTRGIESLNIEGVERWKAGSLENVFRLTSGILADGAKPQLLVAHGRGSVAAYDAAGQAGTEIAVEKRFIRAIHAADLNGDGISELCALAPLDQGRDVALGIDPQGKELWQYELPAGIHEQPIEQVTTGRIGDQPVWIVCGADGSVQFLSIDGRLVDRFQHGAQLTGIASLEIDGAPAIVIASTSGLAAYRVTAK